MNNWNSLETELRGWKPRPPSPELSKRLFRKTAPSPAPAISLAEFWRWVVPALGCLVLVVTSISTHVSNPPFAHFASTNLPRPLGHGTASQSVYFAATRSSCAQNSVPVTTLEISFGEAAPNHNAEFQPTNFLIQ